MQCGSKKGAKTKTRSRGKQIGVRLTAKLAPLGKGKWFAYMPSVMMKVRFSRNVLAMGLLLPQICIFNGSNYMLHHNNYIIADGQ